MDRILLGMAIQAACVATLVALGVIEATARQQALAAVIFAVFALLYKQSGPTPLAPDAALLRAMEEPGTSRGAGEASR
jgi:hypothetical protein